MKPKTLLDRKIYCYQQFTDVSEAVFVFLQGLRKCKKFLFQLYELQTKASIDLKAIIAGIHRKVDAKVTKTHHQSVLHELLGSVVFGAPMRSEVLVFGKVAAQLAAFLDFAPQQVLLVQEHDEARAPHESESSRKAKVIWAFLWSSELTDSSRCSRTRRRPRPVCWSRRPRAASDRSRWRRSGTESYPRL